MPFSRWLGLGTIALALFAVLSSGRVDSQDVPTKPTIIRVLLPDASAVVKINGVVTPKKKETDVRELVAPALAKGKTEYEVTASWRTNNYTKFYRTKKVKPNPGKKVVVDLRKEDPENKDHIEIRYVPTPDDVVERMCKLAKVTRDDVVYDLGCGDGRMVITAVQKFGAKRGVGVDLDPERIKESKENAKEKGVTDKVEFRIGDVLKIADLKDASVILLYMGDDVNVRLRPILQKTLKPGARIVSHRFEMGDWKPDKTETFDGADGDEYTIHLWTIKLPAIKKKPKN